MARGWWCMKTRRGLALPEQLFQPLELLLLHPSPDLPGARGVQHHQAPSRSMQAVVVGIAARLLLVQKVPPQAPPVVVVADGVVDRRADRLHLRLEEQVGGLGLLGDRVPGVDAQGGPRPDGVDGGDGRLQGAGGLHPVDHMGGIAKQMGVGKVDDRELGIGGHGATQAGRRRKVDFNGPLKAGCRPAANSITTLIGSQAGGNGHRPAAADEPQTGQGEGFDFPGRGPYDVRPDRSGTRNRPELLPQASLRKDEAAVIAPWPG